MMKATRGLRFVKRPEGKEVRRILQQLWMDEDPPDEAAIRYEWRDVPCEEQSEAITPALDAAIQDEIEHGPASIMVNE